MDHDTNICTLRQWPASARGVIQVRPGTISGGSCCPLQIRPNTKSGGPLIVWHRAYSFLNTLLPVTIFAEEGEAPGAPSLGYVSFGYILVTVNSYLLCAKTRT